MNAKQSQFAGIEVTDYHRFIPGAGGNERAAEAGTAHEERIDDVFDSEISPRFIDAQEFHKFARANNGFCIDQSDQQRIELDYAKESDRRVMMFRHWRARQGVLCYIMECKNNKGIYEIGMPENYTKFYIQCILTRP